MYGEYFVLVTDKYFGVFEITAEDYPRIFKKSMDCVKCVEGIKIEKYLEKKIGRNSLAKHDYKWYLSLGDVFCR